MNPPRVVAWEVTKKCNLACRHCKADAAALNLRFGNDRQRPELSTGEGLALIDDVAPFHPLLIVTGGEPLLRRDLETLIAHASRSGVRTALATNGLLIGEQRAQRLKACGLSAASVSIDGADAETHDQARGVNGAYESALKAVKALSAAGLSVQVNTTVTKANVSTLPSVSDMVRASGARAWHVFFLVPTGRGNVADCVPTREYFEALHWLETLENAPNGFPLRPTCAPQYRRREGHKGCLAGLSYAFVASDGVVQPCGYLPLNAGNVRRRRFEDIWQNSSVLKTLRAPSQWNNACTTCVYGATCRGCRARAFAVSGDFLGDDPYCGGMAPCTR